jgi:phenylacetic acid degradation operon negative regulatory protein
LRDISTIGDDRWMTSSDEPVRIGRTVGDRNRPDATASAHRGRIADLVDAGPALTARSVLASTLLGTRQPRMPVSALVAAASLFGITAGAARTCLWRMVANGELTADDGTYALAGPLLERRHVVDELTRPGATPGAAWDGTWEISVVALDRRSAADRLELRKAAGELHLAELREGVWARPDNLPADRRPTAQATLTSQCLRFRAAAGELGGDDVRALFALDRWTANARRLIDAMDVEREVGAAAGAGARDVLRYRFSLSVAVVRHLQSDPLLPAALLPGDWPGEVLRSRYRTHVRALQEGLAESIEAEPARR